MKMDESWDWTEDTLTASGFRSAVFVWAAATYTNTHTHTHNTCAHGFIPGFGFKNLMSSNRFHLRSLINLPSHTPTPTSKLKCHTLINGGPYFNSVGRWGRHALSPSRASLLPATKRPPTQSPQNHTSALSHSVANKCDLFSFSSHYHNNKEKLNSPLPCQVKWNK